MKENNGYKQLTNLLAYHFCKAYYTICKHTDIYFIQLCISI